MVPTAWTNSNQFRFWLPSLHQHLHQHSACDLSNKTYQLTARAACAHTHAHTHTHTRRAHTRTHTHTRLIALCPGLPKWAGTRKVKPIWILLEQETLSGSGISLAICNSAPRSREITMPAPHYSVFYRPDALPAAQPTVSKQLIH